MMMTIIIMFTESWQNALYTQRSIRVFIQQIRIIKLLSESLLLLWISCLPWRLGLRQ